MPLGWKAIQKKNGDMYYFNEHTKQTSWDHPLDLIYRKKFYEIKSEGIK